MPDREGLDLSATERLLYRGHDRRRGTDRLRGTDRRRGSIGGLGGADTGTDFAATKGGAIAVTDERVILPGPEGDDGVAVPLENVAELTHRSLDWFLVILGVAIVGFGVASIGRTPLGGLGFVVVGLGSLAITWRRRGRVRVRTHTRAKPITVYPTDSDAFLDAVDAALEPIREDRPPERPSHGVE